MTITTGQMDEMININNVEHREQTTFLMAPRYTERRGQPSLVWLGGEESRPRYQAQNTRVITTDITMTHLKLWLQTKNMDLKMFEALVN